MKRLWLIIAALLSATPVGAQDIHIVLLGTGDPTPRTDRFGPSTLVESGQSRLLVDAGRGVMQRLFEIGVQTSSLDAILITHLHSDHIVGLTGMAAREPDDLAAFDSAFAPRPEIVRLPLPAVGGYEYRESPDLIEPHVRRFLAEIW